MIPYNTGNPIPSTDARDLSDNAANLDDAVNSTVQRWTDRLGIHRETLRGKINKLGIIYDNPIRDWSPLLLVDDLRAHRSPDGEVVIPAKPYPFTTEGTYNPDNWIILQGITEGDVIADLSQEYSFATTGEYISFVHPFPVGKVVVLQERDAKFKVADGTATSNGMDIIASDIHDQQIELILDNVSVINPKQLGLQDSIPDNQTDIMHRSLELADELSVYVELNADISANVDVTDMDVKLRGTGTISPFIRDGSAFRATSNFNTAHIVTGITATEDEQVGERSQAKVSIITVNTIDHGIAVGDIVKIVCEEIIPTTRIGEGCRIGEWGNVLQVTGKDIYIDRILEESYVTSPRLASMKNYELDVDIRLKSTRGNGTKGGALAIIRGYNTPKIKMDLRENDGVGLALHSTYCAEVDATIQNLTNDTANGIYGYGVVEAGTGLSQIKIIQTGSVRHVYTTGVASKTDLAIYNYGEPWHTVVRGVSNGATSNAWDTHSQGNGILFDSVEAYGVQSMFQSRSRGTRIVNALGTDMLYFVQCRNAEPYTQASVEIDGFNIERVKKPFNFKDDSDTDNSPNVKMTGVNYVSYEPTAQSAALDSYANVRIYGHLTMKMLGGRDISVISQTYGSFDLYGVLDVNTVDGLCDRPFRLNRCDFTIHHETGGLLRLRSGSLSRLFTSSDPTAASTVRCWANNVVTANSLSNLHYFEYPFEVEQLTFNSEFTQIQSNSFYFLNTGNQGTEIRFNNLHQVNFIQLSTQAAPNDTISFLSDGNFVGQQLVLSNEDGTTLIIPSSLSNVRFTRTVPEDTALTLTWRGTYWV